ncbi:MAG: T9SS type A sorting domain-containing protein [Dinghuibacter sp.]|nr:T9SS type A sorting domain-containing protein [Dinghuibacter sp.]
MKKKFTHLLSLLLLVFTGPANAQNADHMYFNSVEPIYHYRAASFEIDSALPMYAFRRGILLWAANTGLDFDMPKLSLDEGDIFGNPVTQHYVPQPAIENWQLQPKRIIKSIFSKSYYLLGYVFKSNNWIRNVPVTSTPVVIRLDDNLNPLWIARIHLTALSSATSDALIEYNDIYELGNQNLALVGRFATNSSARQNVLFTRLNHVNGAILWAFHYNLWNCHSNAISVDEASNGDLVATGYAEECNGPAFNGPRTLLFARVNSAGLPVLFRKFVEKAGYDVSGDQITRFESTVAGQNRFFISGYTVVDGNPPSNALLRHRQNLVLDITQGGVINRAIQFGHAGQEEVTDHIFTQRSADSLMLNLTGNTNSYGEPQAYYCTMGYNKTTRVFTVYRYDVIRNTYPDGTKYNARYAQEIKFAGSRLFALLLNSYYTASDGSENIVSNLFLRNFATPDDNICYKPQFPPVKTPVYSVKTFAPARVNPGLQLYAEDWKIDPPIQVKLQCGDKWRVYPEQASGRRRQYEGPGDIVPPPYFPVDTFPPPPIERTMKNGTIVNDLQFKSGILFPNPAENELKLRLNGDFNTASTPVQIDIYSADMKRVRTQRLNSQAVQNVSVSGLQPGLYLLQVRQGSTRHTYRFVKK